jgi:hypothetical protein
MNWCGWRPLYPGLHDAESGLLVEYRNYYEWFKKTDKNEHP